MPNLLDLALPVLIVLFSITLILFFKKLKARRKLQEQKDEQSSLSDEETYQKSHEVLHQAIKRSQEILSLAELESIKLVTSNRFGLSKFGKLYESRINQALKTTEEEIKKDFSLEQEQIKAYIRSYQEQLNQAKDQYLQFLNILKEDGKKNQFITAEALRQRIDQLFSGIEDKISEYMVKSDQRMVMAVELELRSARQLIETYKVQQMNIIDENIMAILEKTISLVLREKLSLKDDLDLIYEALERAKVDKFLV